MTESRPDEPNDPDPGEGEEAAAVPEEAAPGDALTPLGDEPGTQVDRLTDVLLAADRAAEEILEAARGEAREFVSETQRATVERAESLRRETDNLLAQTAELTNRVVELTRATEQVMESFRAELSLDAPEVREETFAAELPEPDPLPEPPAEETAPAIETIPQDEIEVEPTPVAEEGLTAEEATEVHEAAPAAAEEPTAGEVAEPELEPVSEPGEPEADDPDARPAPIVTPSEPQPSTGSFAPPAPPAPSAPPPPPAEEPKRRGLFGRRRKREESAPAPAPAPSGDAAGAAPQGDGGPVTEGARLIARQMLATGLDEAEVKRQLREQFRLADPQAVLDSLRRNERDDPGA